MIESLEAGALLTTRNAASKHPCYRSSPLLCKSRNLCKSMINENSWWWLKRNSERVFERRKHHAGSEYRNDPHVGWVALHALSWFPNVIAIGPAGSWPLWSMRTVRFYGLSVVLWLSFFYAFFRLRRIGAQS